MLEIQAASMADANILSDLERKIFNYDVITLERMRYLLKSKSAVVVKAGRAGLVLGSMILLTRKNSSVLRIYSLGVLKEARRYGLGKKLLRYAEGYGVEKNCNRVHLELHTGNTPALIFYLSEGYSLYGRKDHYYTDGAQALLLRKTIPSGASS